MWKNRILYFAGLSIQSYSRSCYFFFFFFFTEPFFHSKHKQVSMSKTHICLPNKIYLLKVKSAKVAVKYKFLGTENGWMDKHEIELM